MLSSESKSYFYEPGIVPWHLATYLHTLMVIAATTIDSITASDCHDFYKLSKYLTELRKTEGTRLMLGRFSWRFYTSF